MKALYEERATRELRLLGAEGTPPEFKRAVRVVFQVMPPQNAKDWGTVHRAVREMRKDPLTSAAALDSAGRLGGAVAQRQLIRRFGKPPPLTETERLKRRLEGMRKAKSARAKQALTRLEEYEARLTRTENLVKKYRDKVKYYQSIGELEVDET